MLRRGCRLMGSWGPFSPLLINGCEVVFAPIIEHNSCKTYAIYFACICMCTHTFTLSHAYCTVAVLSCGFNQDIHSDFFIYLWLVLLLLCFFLFLPSCRCSWWFSTWFSVKPLYRCKSWLSGFVSFYLYYCFLILFLCVSFFFSLLPRFLCSSCQVWHWYIILTKTKWINK